MKRQKTSKKPLIFAGFVVALTFFFGIQYLTKTGLFKVPGVATYDASLTETEVAFLKPLVEASELERDVTISAVQKTENSAPENALLYDILLPVGDFYDASVSVSSSADNLRLISLQNLQPTERLLALDNHYFFDDMQTGAFFRFLVFDGADPNEAESRVAPALPVFPTESDVLSFAQTGVTALSRAMLTKLNKIGGSSSYFAAKIKDFLSTKDLTHISNESSFSDGATTSNICASWKMLDAITAIGTDIVELTGNHNLDCGDNSARDTLKKYQELDLKTVGGGASAAEAKVPLQLSEKGTNITMLAYNQSTGGSTLDSTPGANQYYENVVKSDIAAAKARGDFVIVDIQYYECWCYPDGFVEATACDHADWSNTYNQKTFFRHLIDLGADVVVGTSAHQPQTFESYKDGFIFYGLGNLFFDQTYWPGTERGLILTHYFIGGRLAQTRISPTIFDEALQVHLMDNSAASAFLSRLAKARP